MAMVPITALSPRSFMFCVFKDPIPARSSKGKTAISPNRLRKKTIMNGCKSELSSRTMPCIEASITVAPSMKNMALLVELNGVVIIISGWLEGNTHGVVFTACSAKAHSTCSRTSDDGSSDRLFSEFITESVPGALPNATAILRSHRSGPIL